MRFFLRALKRKTLTKLILKSRQARLGRPPKKLQKKPSEDQKPQPQLIAGPEFTAVGSDRNDKEESVCTEPFPTLSIIYEEYEPSDHSARHFLREAPANGTTEEHSNAQPTNDDSSSDVSSIGEQGLAAYLRRHHKKLDKSMRAQFKNDDQILAMYDALEGGPNPGNSTLERPTSMISDNGSSIYSENESAKFIDVDMEAILEYTAAENQLPADQIADLNGDMALMRAGLALEDMLQQTLPITSESDKIYPALDAIRLKQTFETEILTTSTTEENL